MFSAFMQGLLSGAAQEHHSQQLRSNLPTEQNRLQSRVQASAASSLHNNSNATNHSASSFRTRSVSNQNRPPLPPMCPHNDRGDTTAADVLEHIGNGDLGSAIRDAVESPAGQAIVEAVRSGAQEMGESMARDGELMKENP